MSQTIRTGSSLDGQSRSVTAHLVCPPREEAADRHPNIEQHMPWKLSDAEYSLLDDYMQVVLSRLQDGHVSLQDAQEDVMQPLTAWDTDKRDQFAPVMEQLLSEWEAGDADDEEDDEEEGAGKTEDDDDEEEEEE